MQSSTSQYILNKSKNDKEIVLAAVKNNDLALKNVSEELKNDKVSDDVSKYGLSFKYTS